MASYGDIRFRLKQTYPATPPDLLDGWIMARHERIMSEMNWDRLESTRPVYTAAEYATGTATVTPTSVVVTGTGTAWDSSHGDLIRINAEPEYYRFRIESATVGSLDRPYIGTGGAYTYRLNRNVYTLPADTRLVRGVMAQASGLRLARLNRSEFNSTFASRNGYGEPAYWCSYFDSDTNPPQTQIEVYPIPTLEKALSVDVAIDGAGLVIGQTSTSLLPWVRTGCLESGVAEDICLWMMTRPGAVQAAWSAAADRHAKNFQAQLESMVKADVSRQGTQKLHGNPKLSRHRVERWAGAESDPVRIVS